MSHTSRRQANLPTATPAAGAGRRMPGFDVGRVVYVDYEAGTLDVMLDDGTVLEGVEVLCRQSGPDRQDEDLPLPRSPVALMYAQGSKNAPWVIGVLPRRTKRKKRGKQDDPKTRGVRRRIYPSGTHTAVYDDGSLELRLADGTYLVLNADGEPKEDHTGQDREGWDGDPFQDPEPVKQEKPKQFHLRITMPDGSKVHLHEGQLEIELPEALKLKAPTVNVECDNATVKASQSAKVEAGEASIKATGKASIEAAEATVKASAQATVEASGQATVKGAMVNVEASGVCEVKGLLLRLNGGLKPVASILDVAIPAGPGNPTILV